MLTRRTGPCAWGRARRFRVQGRGGYRLRRSARRLHSPRALHSTPRRCNSGCSRGGLRVHPDEFGDDGDHGKCDEEDSRRPRPGGHCRQPDRTDDACNHETSGGQERRRCMRLDLSPGRPLADVSESSTPVEVCAFMSSHPRRPTCRLPIGLMPKALDVFITLRVNSSTGPASCSTPASRFAMTSPTTASTHTPSFSQSSDRRCRPCYGLGSFRGGATGNTKGDNLIMMGFIP